jgi:hypothetical protein
MAWVGPLGADQDFVFEDRRYEIKTIRQGADSIGISSAEQLDVTAQQLNLVVVILDDVPVESGGASFSALELVNRVRSLVSSIPAALDKLDERLVAAGFIEREEYGTYRFACRRIRQFRVDWNFPRLVRSALPHGIGRVTYEIRLEDCLPFEDCDTVTTE